MPENGKRDAISASAEPATSRAPRSSKVESDPDRVSAEQMYRRGRDRSLRAVPDSFIQGD